MSAIGVGSGCDEASCLNTALSGSRVEADEVQGNVFQDCEVMSSMAGTGTHLIVSKGDIHTPMQAIFDTPM